MTGVSQHLRSWIAGAIIAIICGLWLLPTLGLFISSLRSPDDVRDSGWWSIFPHPSWQVVETIVPDASLDRSAPMTLGGVTGTFEELRRGIVAPDGRKVTWVGNRRAGTVRISEEVWTADLEFTLDNYANVLTGKQYEVTNAAGVTVTLKGDDLSGAFLNSLAVTMPSVLLPLVVGAFAAYGFAWIRFRGRGLLFGVVIALIVVPLQVSLVPVLSDYVKVGLNGTYLAVWLAHSGFGLPLAIYLLYTFIAGLPRELLESATLDGASHLTIFRTIVVPLAAPALASYAIFQFLWVWNDYLVALIFIGSQPGRQVLTMRLAEIVGSRGDDWHLLTAGAFVSLVLPLIVFFALQRHFVRGLTAGAVKS